MVTRLPGSTCVVTRSKRSYTLVVTGPLGAVASNEVKGPAPAVGLYWVTARPSAS